MKFFFFHQQRIIFKDEGLFFLFTSLLVNFLRKNDYVTYYITEVLNGFFKLGIRIAFGTEPKQVHQTNRLVVTSKV